MPTIKEVISEVLLEEYEIDISDLPFTTKLSDLGVDTDSLLLIGQLICKRYGLTFNGDDWYCIRVLGDFTVVINRAEIAAAKSKLGDAPVLDEDEFESPVGPETIYDTATGVPIGSLLPELTAHELESLRDNKDPLEQFLKKSRKVLR